MAQRAMSATTTSDQAASGPAESFILHLTGSRWDSPVTRSHPSIATAQTAYANRTPSSRARFFGCNVLVEIDAVARDEQLVHGRRERTVRVGTDFHRRRVGANHGDFFVGKQLRGGEAKTRRAAQIPRVVLRPERAPARVDDHDITGANLDALTLKRVRHVLDW